MENVYVGDKIRPMRQEVLALLRMIMMRKWLLIFAITCAFAAVTIDLISLFARTASSKRDAQVVASMKVELPVGSSRDQVLMFLRSHNIVNSGYVTASAVEEENRTIGAVLRHDNPLALTNRSTHIVFSFNESGKLKSIAAKDVFAGL